MPAFDVQVSKVVVTRTVIVMSLEMCEPYCDGSIVNIIFPLLLVESPIVAQLLIALPSELSAIA